MPNINVNCPTFRAVCAKYLVQCHNCSNNSGSTVQQLPRQDNFAVTSCQGGSTRAFAKERQRMLLDALRSTVMAIATTLYVGSQDGRAAVNQNYGSLLMVANHFDEHTVVTSDHTYDVWDTIGVFDILKKLYDTLQPALQTTDPCATAAEVSCCGQDALARTIDTTMHAIAFHPTILGSAFHALIEQINVEALVAAINDPLCQEHTTKSEA